MSGVLNLLRRHISIASCALLFSVALFAAETPIPTTPDTWVTDTAHFMSPAVASDLNARLKAYQQQTGHQLLVWIGNTTGDASIEEWGVRAITKWNAEGKGIDDGLVLFVMAQDRKLRLQVGYRLEGVPDAVASRVIRDMTPQIRAGNQDGAIVAAMEALTTAIGEPSLPGGGNRAAEPKFAAKTGIERVGTVNTAALSVGILLFLLLVLGAILAMIVGIWKVFTKAGKPGWASFIPIYNVVVLLEIVGRPVWWFILFIVPFVNIIIAVIVMMDLAKSYGKGNGYGLGLVFLGFIFFPMLGLGSAQYKGPSTSALS